MSDFDDVLERLLTDPTFPAQLAADPSRVLAGYRLSAEEVELLRAQVTGDAGGQRTVEQRTSKASLFGLLSPLAGIGGSIGDLPGTGVGNAVASGTPSIPDSAPVEVIAEAPAGVVVEAGLGGVAEAGLGGVAEAGLDGVAEAGLGAAPDEPPAAAVLAPAVVPPPAGGPLGRQLDGMLQDVLKPPAQVEDYHTRVDADGDGRWDEHLYVSRADGGVDIVVDANHDGRVDFVGHDLDRDRLIDSATTDSDRDGRLDTEWVDVNGDGWLDKKA